MHRNSCRRNAKWSGKWYDPCIICFEICLIWSKTISLTIYLCFSSLGPVFSSDLLATLPIYWRTLFIYYHDNLVVTPNSSNINFLLVVVIYELLHIFVSLLTALFADVFLPLTFSHPRTSCWRSIIYELPTLSRWLRRSVKFIDYDNLVLVQYIVNPHFPVLFC